MQWLLQGGITVWRPVLHEKLLGYDFTIIDMPEIYITRRKLPRPDMENVTLFTQTYFQTKIYTQEKNTKIYKIFSHFPKIYPNNLL